MAATPIEEAIVATVRDLPPEQQQEVLDFASFLGMKQKRPLKSMYGLWQDLGVALSEEDIAEARRLNPGAGQSGCSGQGTFLPSSL